MIYRNIEIHGWRNSAITGSVSTHVSSTALTIFHPFKLNTTGQCILPLKRPIRHWGFIDTAPEVYKKILNSRSAHEAKKIAHEYKELRRPDWDSVKVSIMEELLRAKLAQHPYVRKKLLETKNYPLVEDSPTDSFYGCGQNLNGDNILGKLWEKLRAELQTQLEELV